MSAVSTPSTSPDRQPRGGAAVRFSDWNAPRRGKETLLPQFVQLALEGHSAEAIARQFDMPGRTVRYWLHESRQEWLAASAGGAAEMLAVTMARLTEIYREALEEWRVYLDILSADQLRAVLETVHQTRTRLDFRQVPAITPPQE